MMNLDCNAILLKLICLLSNHVLVWVEQADKQTGKAVEGDCTSKQTAQATASRQASKETSRGAG